MKKTKEQNKSPEKPNIFLLLKPYKIWVILLVIVALVSSGVNLLIPKIISHTIDSFADGKFSLNSLIISFSVASLVIFVFTYLQSILQTFVSERVAKNLRSQISDKISQQSYAFVLKANPSRLLTNLTSDVDSIKMFVSQAVATIVSSLFVIVATSVLLIQINCKLALPVLAIIPLIGGTFFFVLGKVKVLFKKSRENIDRLNKIINESILGAALIRVVNSQQSEYEKFMNTNTDAKNIGLSILRMFASLIPIIMFVSNMAVITILALGGHFVVQGSMSLGEFAAFFSYLTLLIFPILMIGFMSNIIAQASASYSRISNVLNAPLLAATGQKDSELSGLIEISNVNLNYGEKPVLKSLSLTVEAGSHTAIIGPTAAGKSQLLYLITNIIKPDSGSILFDGSPVGAYNSEAFHKQIGFVFQDSVIFNLSLRENIAFSGTVTDESLRKALETAELTDFVDSLPNKLDTVVSERGSNLSGGQKQRIMLARALALNPKILLLDDFTARIDRKTEQKILCNIENNYPNITLVSVTQKLSSVKHFEKIILLMEGELIAMGNHKHLLETCPEYVQVYNSQRSTSHYEL